MDYDYDYEHPSSVAVTNVERRMLLRRVDEHDG